MNKITFANNSIIYLTKQNCLGELTMAFLSGEANLYC